MKLSTLLFCNMIVFSFGLLLGPSFGIFAFGFRRLSIKKCMYLGIALDLLITTIIALIVIVITSTD